MVHICITARCLNVLLDCNSPCGWTKVARLIRMKISLSHVSYIALLQPISRCSILAIL